MNILMMKRDGGGWMSVLSEEILVPLKSERFKTNFTCFLGFNVTLKNYLFVILDCFYTFHSSNIYIQQL